MSLITSDQVRAFLTEYLLEQPTAQTLNPEELDDNFDFFQAGIIDSLGIEKLVNSSVRNSTTAITSLTRKARKLPSSSFFFGSAGLASVRSGAGSEVDSELESGAAAGAISFIG